jgi:hypothetical protein
VKEWNDLGFNELILSYTDSSAIQSLRWQVLWNYNSINIINIFIFSNRRPSLSVLAMTHSHIEHVCRVQMQTFQISLYVHETLSVGI